MFSPVEQNPNFPELEKKQLDHWYKNGVVEKYLHKNDSADKTFSFLDGPITANNPMGIHHAWGRTYKDLWQKFYNLLGYRQRFQNGFDCQGLWVEVEVEKEVGVRTKKDIENLVPGDRKASIAKFVQLCKDRVKKFSGIQTEQTKRLGNFMDWNNSYFTMSDENNYMIWHFLKTCFDRGWIYKGHESVPWCPRCETAISQHEMLTEDYKELVHESIYVRFPIVDKKDEYLLVWTTTPWTLPANIAVTVDKDFDYVLVETQDKKKYWIVKELEKSVFEKDLHTVIKTAKGKELVGLKYKGAFDDLPAVQKVVENKLFHTVVATDKLIMPIATTEGTGLVHTAVSAGVEDFKLGRKIGLPMIPVIADNADYIDGLGFLSGQNAKKHPRIVLDFMDEKGFAYKIHNYKHRYPACWRCKTELVWKVADEWYIAMDVPSKIRNSTLRQKMIQVAKSIKWMPEFGLDRELDWLKNMHDWLISKKNRYWGLALPIYECDKCGIFEVLGSKEDLKKRAVSGWDELEGHSPHKPYIDEVKIKCQKCGEVINRIDDVGNPWLDAGIVGFSTVKRNNQGEPLYLTDRNEWKKWIPADFITESFPGQFKNWFYSLIAMSTVLEDAPQFKTVLGFATMLGEDGRPMHKSWSNSVEFNEGADKIGVDVIRWMSARQNPADNMLFGYKRADEVRRQFYLMLWNIYKFFVEYANLDKFKVQSSNVKSSSKPKVQRVNILDKWIESRINWLVQFSEKSLKEFNVKDVALESEKFVNDLSTWFIRRSRNRVWVNTDDESDKQAIYKTLYTVLVDLSVILSPIMPFISDMIYTSLTGNESVHLSTWPLVPKENIDIKLIADMVVVRQLCEVGHRVRKEQKLRVKQPLLKATITVSSAMTFKIVSHRAEYEQLLREELNVKHIEIMIGKNDVTEVVFDITLTDELIHEGKLRDLIRQIQDKRRELGKKQVDTIVLTVPKEFENNLEYLKRRVMASTVEIADEVKVS